MSQLQVELTHTRESYNSLSHNVPTYPHVLPFRNNRPRLYKNQVLSPFERRIGLDRESRYISTLVDYFYGLLHL